MSASRALRWSAAVVLVAGAAYLGWRWVRGPAPSDLVGALQANNRGVGFMDRYDFEKAVAAFEEADKLAPDWPPARINLGIALMNTGQAPQHPNLERAAALFEEILKGQPRNPHA